MKRILGAFLRYVLPMVLALALLRYVDFFVDPPAGGEYAWAISWVMACTFAAAALTWNGRRKKSKS